jgi:5-methylthioadenosine/S-adenosylhomocysteine deaminase
MLSAKETFDIATKAAANIFFLPEWEIKIGNSPDIILVDTKKLELKPGFDIFSDIVYASNGYIVDTVICMGKVLMEDRYVPGEEDIIEEFSKTAHRLATK